MTKPVTAHDDARPPRITFADNEPALSEADVEALEADFDDFSVVRRCALAMLARSRDQIGEAPDEETREMLAELAGGIVAYIDRLCVMLDFMQAALTRVADLSHLVEAEPVVAPEEEQS